ncbi:MAG TPA: ABC transporter substrate-binding protein, partial [Limnobacter sp.]|nr:ABC transporter substrate-binding protein [Limnobacter sp.]
MRICTKRWLFRDVIGTLTGVWKTYAFGCAPQLASSMNKRFLLVLLLLIAPLARAAEPIAIGVSKNILSLPVVVAHEMGFFKKHQVNVRLHDCVTGSKCLAGMLEGQSDLATATELPVVLQSFKRQDFAIVATFVTTSNDMKILARKTAGIHAPSDLLGKRVAYVQGTASQYFLDTVLVYSGIDPQRVNRQPMQVDEVVKAMQQGQLDAVCLWEPYVSLIEAHDEPAFQLLPVPRLYIETFNLIASQRTLENRPQDIQRILMALKEGIQFIENSPESAISLLVKRLNVPSAVIERVWGDYRFRLSLGKFLPRTMDGQARWALRAGHAPRNARQPNALDLLDTRFLLAVDPQSVTIP